MLCYMKEANQVEMMTNAGSSIMFDHLPATVDNSTTVSRLGSLGPRQLTMQPAVILTTKT